MKRKGEFNYFISLWSAIILISVIITGCSNDTGNTELMIAENQSSEVINEQSTTLSGKIYVYVCGEVNEPGVYEVDTGARLYEVIELAGGMTDNAAEGYLNLAKEITDGEQIDVISADEYEQMYSAAAEYGAADDGLININTATASELTALPGIGDAKAAAIVAYREANGDFATIEDIMNVDGIKDGSFSKIQNLIKVK